MWFLEIYFRDGSEKMFIRSSYTSIIRLRDSFIASCAEEIHHFEDYFIIGNVESRPVTTLVYPFP